MKFKVSDKIKDWGRENSLVLVYFVFAVLLEMSAVFVVEGSPFLSRPFLSIGLLVFICGILLIVKNRRARAIIGTVLLALQGVLDLVFAVIYDMTDQYFDLGMFNLRNDAFAILENIPVNFITFYAGLLFAVGFLIYGLRFAHHQPRSREPKKSAFFYVALSMAGIATLGISFLTYYPREAKNKYDEMIDGKAQSAYSAYGMIGNLLGEVGKAAFQKITPIAEEDINEYIYGGGVADTTDYFGICKDKNVVVILAESLEWYSFLQGDNTAGRLEEEYVHYLQLAEKKEEENVDSTGSSDSAQAIDSADSSVEEELSEEERLAAARAQLKADLRVLYPNLTRYYEESLVMTNFHGREKTDIAETTSIIGSYPTDAYVNYEYAANTIPYTLPNIMKSVEGRKAAEVQRNVQTRSFHNGFKSFYNREQAHGAFGFDKMDGKDCPIDMYDMEKTGKMYNYMDEGERNLDSEMIAAGKDWMFPTDGSRFYTYITTITMHGMYYDRANLRKENNTKLAAQLEILEKYKPDDETAPYYQNDVNLYYYMTTALEFDYMLGEMNRDLTEKGLIDDTVIVLFGDHNAYYQEMSNYVKGIPNSMNDSSDKKFTDLYNVPFMIWDKDLLAEIDKNKDGEIIDKFTCTADIVPTLLDLLGIRYFKNMYYGTSVFSPEASVLYSRAYGVFISDGIIRRSVKGELYRYNGLTETGIPVADTLTAFEETGTKLVEKIKYCDYIFRQNHFGSEQNYRRFQEEMKKINP